MHVSKPYLLSFLQRQSEGCLPEPAGSVPASADDVRSECAHLQRLLATSDQRCQHLQSALLSVQQEHRILLQKVMKSILLE